MNTTGYASSSPLKWLIWSYRRAREVLRRVPLDTKDEWGDIEDFMVRARPDAG